MKLYLKLLELGKPVFTIEDVVSIDKHLPYAKNHIGKLVRMGLVARIRKNLYTCISLETKQPIANKYQIASAITKTSFLSHHTAMEYYGCQDQVFYEVYVSSLSKFTDFEFEGHLYKCVITKSLDFIEHPKNTSHICVSSIERALIDSIKEMDKIAGLEEVMANIESIWKVDESKLLECLALYDNQFLYQKVGFLLSSFQNTLHLSQNFFAECQKKIGKSRRYLTNTSQCHHLIREWSLIVPKNIYEMKNGGTP